MSMARLAVDIGGTFTDFALEIDGTFHSRKVLTTPQAPEQAVVEGLALILEDAGLRHEDLDLVVHGTTLATNALIERKGARTALLVTAGFRDAVEMAHENRFEQYDIFMERPEPLVPRQWRLPVRERIDAGGNIVTPLDESSVALLVPILREAGIASVAVGFLHSYANPAHEKQTGALLRSMAPDLSVTLSSDVSPEIREYERWSTACANAYVQPVIDRYIARLETRLQELGVTAPLFLITSAGSLTTPAFARRFPIRLVESGPAGGAILATHIAAQYGLDRIVSFDMGGTTAKICLIDDALPTFSRSFEVARQYRFLKGSGIPVRIPVIDMVEIGAGGGSIASVDAMGRVQVGPESAASEPGPACYGRGGVRGTVTDADLITGRIRADAFAGGRMALDIDASRAAVLGAVGSVLGGDPLAAAIGVIEVVEENMANAARIHAVETGRELANRSMIAFGGAAPLHAGRLAERLGIDTVVVPSGAGVGSAIGFLLTPIAYDVARTHRVMLDAGFDPAAVNGLRARMLAEAEEIIRPALPDQSLEQRWTADMRYRGQGHEVSVVVGPDAFEGADVQRLRALFIARYVEQFGREIPGLDVEILSWTLRLSAARRPVGPPPRSLPDQVVQPEDHVAVVDPTSAVPVMIPLYKRQSLVAGSRLDGPALLVEDETTTFVTSGFCARLNELGHIVMTRIVSPARLPTAGALVQIRLQAMWDRLLSVVEEQAQTLVRIGFSTSTREAGDVSAGVFDVSGRMIAQAVTGTPGHVNSMARSVRHFLARFPPDTISLGDVFITNDPWKGTGHLHDFTVVTPAFFDGRLVGLLACTCHVIDIGGRGMGPEARSVLEEGIFVPIRRLATAARVDETLIDLIASNVREPIQVVGDIYSLAGSNEVAVRRLVQMMKEFDIGSLETLGGHIIERSRAATVEAISQLPNGRWRNAMRVDGYDEPLELVATMTIGDGVITVDFAGTSPPSRFGINVPFCYTEAYASFGVKCIVAPKVPNNAGSLAPIRILPPENSILDAQSPLPVATRHIVGQLLPDLVIGCLAQALDGNVPAEGTSCLWNLFAAGGAGMVDVAPAELRDAKVFNVMSFHSGGTGARPGNDGLSATAFPSGVKNVPTEVTETMSPLLIRRKEFRTDSGGAGVFRGGLGQIMEVVNLDDAPFTVSANYDRVLFPPRGRDEGGDGATGIVSLGSGVTLNGKGRQIVPRGDALILEMPGGGGLGNPLKRDPERVARDVRLGMVSAAAARDLYGVVLTPDLGVDVDATASLRAARGMSRL